MTVRVLPMRKDGTRGYATRSSAEIKGPNSEPLTPSELFRWNRAELDPLMRAKREAMHVAHMVQGLGLCAGCWGWVDDPRHLAVGAPARTL